MTRTHVHPRPMKSVVVECKHPYEVRSIRVVGHPDVDPRAGTVERHLCTVCRAVKLTLNGADWMPWTNPLYK